MVVSVSLEHGSSESGLAVHTGGDIESGISVPKAASIRKLLGRYTRRQSEVYAESTHLVISVEDSGAGISTVFFPSSPSQLLRLRNLIIQYHYDMTGESDQAVQRSGAVPARVTAEGTGHGTGTLQ